MFDDILCSSVVWNLNVNLDYFFLNEKMQRPLRKIHLHEEWCKMNFLGAVKYLLFINLHCRYSMAWFMRQNIKVKCYPFCYIICHLIHRLLISFIFMFLENLWGFISYYLYLFFNLIAKRKHFIHAATPKYISLLSFVHGIVLGFLPDRNKTLMCSKVSNTWMKY